MVTPSVNATQPSNSLKAQQRGANAANCTLDPMHKLLLSALLVSTGIASWHFIRTAKPSPEELSAIHKSALDDSGISQGGVDAMMSTDPNDLLSIIDLPEEIRSSFNEELEKERLNGFGEVSDFHANEIVNIDNYIIGSDLSETTISFQPSKLPSHLVENYDYVGYTHPNYSIKKRVSDTAG